jgi:hypothetical protein
MGQVVIATRKYLFVSFHLLDNLDDPSQVSQHQKNGSRFALFKSLAT